MKKFLTVLVFLFGALYCYGIAINDMILQAFSKPIPVMLILAQVRPASKYNFLIMAGLLFSLVGDVLLLNIIDKFLYGLIAFLTAHIFYTIAFLVRDHRVKSVSVLFFYALGGGLLYFMYPHLGGFVKPVIVYVFVIITMLWRAYMQRNYNKAAVYAYMGAMTFVFSDFILAYNRFVASFQYSGILTIVIYWTAQFMIAKSTLKTE